MPFKMTDQDEDAAALAAPQGDFAPLRFGWRKFA
jgi:hypothetical protein